MNLLLNILICSYSFLAVYGGWQCVWIKGVNIPSFFHFFTFLKAVCPSATKLPAGGCYNSGIYICQCATGNFIEKFTIYSLKYFFQPTLK